MAVNKSSNAEITSAINNLKRQKKNSAKANQNYTKSNKKSTSKAQNKAAESIEKTESGSKNRSRSAYRYSKNYRKPSKPLSKLKASPVKLTPLGGLGEIGKNITLYEYENDMFLVDCGMSFPDEEMPGIDIVIPDFSHIVKNVDRIRGLVVTHGHEDHIGAIPYLLRECNIPIYGTALTVGLIRGKLKEHKLLESAKLNVVKPGDKVSLGAFSVEFIHVNHSIPDAVAVAVSSPAGLIVQTGDFKIDTTPIDGHVIDLGRFAELGKSGVLALLSDSTNAERPGFTQSERIVGESFSNLFKKAGNRRIVVATFSSNIHRVQQIIDEAVRCDRKVAVSGRSMQNVVQVASELGYLNVPDNVLIDIDMIKRYMPEQLVIITTGSQGEPMSALHRMAFNDHRKVLIGPSDMIIISATPIPGNEKTVTKVINELMKLQAEVVYEKMYDVHVSGHACQDELKIMLDIVKPKYFIPVHGEQKHLVKHAGLAEAVGVPSENILIGANGNVVEICEDYMKVVETVQAGEVLVDGFGVGDVGNVVLRDRKHLAEDGIFVVAVSVDSVTREVIAGPDVISRGFVYVKESEELMDEAREVVCDVLEKCYLSNIRDWSTVKSRVRDGLARFLYEQTGRSPMVLPIFMEI
ncbi:MAG: ribonuclease J [Ruminococcaceae bacterium]|nr:ribonuclease J [Oscillospiraceae bacterium]